MIGCLLLVPVTGAFVLMGIYMSALMGYLVAAATALGIYMTAMASYFTALFILIFG